MPESLVHAVFTAPLQTYPALLPTVAPARYHLFGDWRLDSTAPTEHSTGKFCWQWPQQATFVSFLRLVVPKYLPALILLYFLMPVWYSPYVGALYSPEYVIQDHFLIAKLWNFFLHTWPILFISIGQDWPIPLV